VQATQVSGFQAGAVGQLKSKSNKEFLLSVAGTLAQHWHGVQAAGHRQAHRCHHAVQKSSQVDDILKSQELCFER
jgi:hypothetical protein